MPTIHKTVLIKFHLLGFSIPGVASGGVGTGSGIGIAGVGGIGIGVGTGVGTGNRTGLTASCLMLSVIKSLVSFATFLANVPGFMFVNPKILDAS